MGKTTLAVLPVALLFALGFTHFQLNKKEPLPPAPPGSFIFGNALEICKAKYLWLKLADLANLYGPILTLRLPVSPVIVVSDTETVTELFEKRSSNFSNRPVIQMVHLSGWGNRVIFTQYNQTWRLYRKLLHRALNSQVTPDYQEVQVYEVHRLMKRLVDDPSNFLSDVHLMVGSASVRILYGHTVQGPDDRFIVASEEIMSAVKEAIVPGRWLVDTLPILRFIPSWFPGATFKRKTEEWARKTAEHRRASLDYVLTNMARGSTETSFVSKLLEPEDGTQVTAEEKEIIKQLASSLYDASVDTSASLIQSFFLAMTLYPDVQKKAQDEIDEYFSANKEDVRILNVADRENLPFTKALASEVLRWHPVTNVAVHNSGEKEEHIRGYRIPPGTMVIANIWAMLHDSTVYENPAEFDPNRFLSDRPAPDPALYAFGFGRRSCPGMHLGQQLLWLTISNILAHFTTSKALDDQGNEITPSEEYTTTSVLSRPMPFKCSITARSSDSMSFVRSVEA